MKLLILTGASGSGKTTITKALLAERADIHCHFFDSIGVPSFEQMVAEHGSGEGWQRAMTIEWLRRIKATHPTGSRVVLEGQARISFIKEAIELSGLESTEIVLIDCSDESRHERLCVHRAQPELADENMMNWASFLRNEARANQCEILDTSGRSIEDCVRVICGKF